MSMKLIRELYGLGEQKTAVKPAAAAALSPEIQELLDLIKKILQKQQGKTMSLTALGIGLGDNFDKKKWGKLSSFLMDDPCFEVVNPNAGNATVKLVSAAATASDSAVVSSQGQEQTRKDPYSGVPNPMRMRSVAPAQTGNTGMRMSRVDDGSSSKEEGSSAADAKDVSIWKMVQSDGATLGGKNNKNSSYAEVLNTPSANPPTVNTTKDEEETPLTEEERFRQDVRKVLVRLKETSTDARIRALVRNTQEYYKRTGKTWHSKVCRFGTEKCRDRNNCPHLHNEGEDVIARALIRRYSENPMFAKELCDPLPGKVCKDSVNCQFRHPELGDETPPPPPS